MDRVRDGLPPARLPWSPALPYSRPRKSNRFQSGGQKDKARKTQGWICFWLWTASRCSSKECPLRPGSSARLQLGRERPRPPCPRTYQQRPRGWSLHEKACSHWVDAPRSLDLLLLVACNAVVSWDWPQPGRSFSPAAINPNLSGHDGGRSGGPASGDATATAWAMLRHSAPRHLTPSARCQLPCTWLLGVHGPVRGREQAHLQAVDCIAVIVTDSGLSHGGDLGGVVVMARGALLGLKAATNELF